MNGTAFHIKSLSEFKLEEWKQFNDKRPTELITNDENGNVRTYNVKWSDSGKLETFKRNLDNVSLRQRFSETWARGFWTPSTAQCFATIATELSTEEKAEKIGETTKNIDTLILQLRTAPIDKFFFHTLFPYSIEREENKEKIADLTKFCDECSTKHQTAVQAKTTKLINELDNLKRQITSTEQTNDFDHKLKEITYSIGNVGAKIENLSNQKEKHSALLKELSTTLNFCNTPLLEQIIKARLTGLTDVLSEWIESGENGEDQAKFLTQQFEVAIKLNIKASNIPSSLRNEQNAGVPNLTVCGELLTSPTNLNFIHYEENEQNGEQLPLPIDFQDVLHERRSATLRNALSNCTTCWKEIIKPAMVELAHYKNARANQIATADKIRNFLNGRNVDSSERLQELRNLKLQLEVPGPAIESEALCHRAETIMLGEEVTQFLNQEIVEAAFSNNFYDATMQSRINSLRHIVEMCMKSTHPPKIEVLEAKAKAKEHEAALLEWNVQHSVAGRLFGNYDHILKGQTFEDREFLAVQIAASERITQFISNRTSDNIISSNRLVALQSLLNKLNSEEFVQRGSDVYLHAEQHMEAIMLGESITDFLDKNVAGVRGKHAISGHYYDEEMQSRINSLQLIEKNCRDLTEPIYVDENLINGHKLKLDQWKCNNDSVQLCGPHEHVPFNTTYEQRRIELTEKKLRDTTIDLARGLSAARKAQIEINFYKHSLSKLATKSVQLEESTKILKEKVTHLKNDQSWTGKIVNFFNEIYVGITNFFAWIKVFFLGIINSFNK